VNIKVKKHFKEMPDLKILEKGDWIDLMICDVEVFDKSLKAVEEFPGVETKYIFKKGNMYLINLGVSIKFPKGYEAYVLPRSSTPKKYGLILGNSQGIIDSSYCGNSDIWKALVYTTKDVEIERFTRLFQFRIQLNQPKINIEYVENMSDVSRGGFGSTGH
jgi:dUTP pyrophosphatase